MPLSPELKRRLRVFASKNLPFLKIPPPEMDREGAFTLRPGRNSLLKWEKQEDGKTILTVPMNPKSGKLTTMLAAWLRAPSERHVELDEVGAYVWELCDGNHTVATIAQKTGREYKMNRREAEVSVTTFLQMLHERNFIGFYKKTRNKSNSS